MPLPFIGNLGLSADASRLRLDPSGKVGGCRVYEPPAAPLPRGRFDFLIARR
jgi:hypothetical protein